MTRFLLKILFYVVIIVLVYNYFLGNSAEKDSSQKIFSEVKTVLVSVKDLLGAEKQKFDQGKYDEALEKIKQGIDKIGSLKDKSADLSNDLESAKKQQKLAQNQLNIIKSKGISEDNDVHVQELKKTTETLTNMLQKLAKQADAD